MNAAKYASLPSARRCNTAFTRVELGVVLAIATVLIFSLIPLLSGGKDKDIARRQVCLSNLKTLGAAFAQYAADNDSCYPPYTNNIMMAKAKWMVKDKFGRTLRSNPAQPDLLVASLKSYVPANTFWFCPSDPLAHNNNAVRNHVVGMISSDHRYSSYISQEAFANYPTTPGGFETIEKSGKHFMVGGQDPAERRLLTEEYITVSPPHSFLADLLHTSPRSPALYSHNGRLNWVAMDGHVGSTELPVY